jgi:acyl-lipid omega-6 desaturase (Delta-12 desaturase)
VLAATPCHVTQTTITSTRRTNALTPASSTNVNAKQWTSTLQRYRKPNLARSVGEILITALPFAGLWVVMWASLAWSYWLTLLFALPAAGFLVRLFMIQHDCGHGSFFRNRRANDWVGRVLGVVTLTPYDHWRESHAVHHATSGNLDHRGIGDIDTLTVREYLSLSRWGRLRYRLYRNPAVMFGIGPAYLFLLKNRFPLPGRAGRRAWLSTGLTNAAIAAIVVCVIWLLGVWSFMLVQLPIVLLAASIGVWLFYVQHQFENTFWATQQNWTVHDAALHGSSHYDLPPVLQWMSANIGIHHVHHLCSRIPFYRLPSVVKDHPALQNASKLTIAKSVKCVRLALWHETEQRLISFRELRGRAAAQRPSGDNAEALRVRNHDA